MLANHAFVGISRGVASLARAGVAWTLVSDLFRAARAPTEQTPQPSLVQAGAEGPRRRLIDASDVVFRYRPEGRAILRGLDLTIYQGERILLAGASGGGK